MLMAMPKIIVAIPFNFVLFAMPKTSNYAERIASIMDTTLDEATLLGARCGLGRCFWAVSDFSKPQCILVDFPCTSRSQILNIRSSKFIYFAVIFL